MHTLLITGFDARTGDPSNPSERLVANLRSPAGACLERLVLPTVYDVADRLLVDAIEASMPAAVLMFGVSATADPLVVELAARNGDTSPKADNHGQHGRPVIIPGAPDALDTTAPVRNLQTALHAAAIPYRLSIDAGGYLCNRVYYVALHNLAGSGVPCAFVHVSRAAEAEVGRGAALMVEVLAAVVAACGPAPA